MIIRIFKVTIDPNHRVEFEKGFYTTSVDSIKDRPGLISWQVGKPTTGNLNDYVMITQWKDKASVVAFAGTDWKKSVVPKSMEKYSANCSVEHYELQEI